jgi:hypothetical protein
MKEINDKILSKGTLLIILILFMFSSKISDITINIVKYFFYLILIINVVNYLNPSIAKQIKEIIIGLINIDSNGYFIKENLSKLSTGILNNIEDKPNIYVKTKFDVVPLNNTSINENNRNLHNTSINENNRNLHNT